jgi:hypothetical protein
VTVNVGTLPVDPATIRLGVLGEESTPVELMLTVPGAAFAAIWPKFSVVAVPFTAFVIEIGATTVASALVVTDAVGPAANAAVEENRPSTAAETRSLFMDLLPFRFTCRRRNPPWIPCSHGKMRLEVAANEVKGTLRIHSPQNGVFLFRNDCETAL